jgi:hypothetical protein
MNKKLLVWGAVILGIVLIATACMYWFVPASSLPAFMPGFKADSPHVHLKHGIAAMLLALALFAYAWFNSGGASPHEEQKKN